MPILAYKPFLKEDVLTGKKAHTIRFAKRLWKVGDTAYHATGVRTPAYDNFRTDLVTHIDEIQIEVIETAGARIQSSVTLNGTRLNGMAVAELAKADGFLSTAGFFQFFIATMGHGVHTGQLIHWGPNPTPYVTLSLAWDLQRPASAA